MELSPQEKMDRAADEIVLKHRFFAVLKSQLKWRPDPAAGTAWTNGKEVGWSPKFIAGLTHAKVVGVCVHEMAHPMFKHHLRRGNKEPRRWNKACDLAINPLIVEWGFVLPDGALFREDCKGLSVEAIYDLLTKEDQEKQQQKQQQMKKDQEESDGDDQESGDDSGEAGEGDQDDGDDDRDSSPEDSDQEDEESKGKGSNDDDESAEEQEQGEDGQGESEEEQESLNSDDGPADEGQDEEDSDPGGCGEVRDAVDDEGNPASEEEKEIQSHQWNVSISQAEKIADIAKQMGAGLKRTIGEILRPDVPWQEILQSLMNERSRDDYSWMRPSRRHLANDIHFPSLSANTIGTGVLVIDSSGSIDEAKFTEFMANLRAVLETFEVELFVIVADSVVQWSGYVTADALESVEPLGHGGTDFRPAFQLVEDEGIEPKFLIYFTDLECWRWPEDPGYPVIWACWGRHPVTPPFGDTVMIK